MIDATQTANDISNLATDMEHEIVTLREGVKSLEDALSIQSTEVKILREGLCDIAKTAIQHMDPTYGDMATDTLGDANAAQTRQEQDD